MVARGSGKRGMDSDCLIGMEVLLEVIMKFWILVIKMVAVLRCEGN